ncbi:hypothetical protein ACHAW6_008226 [Cyclotella cf. meneghiniana]
MREQYKPSCTWQDHLRCMSFSFGVRMAQMILLFSFLQWITPRGYTIEYHNGSAVLPLLRWSLKTRQTITT